MEALLKTFDLLPQDVPMIFLGGVFFYIFCKLFGKYVVQPYLHLVEVREAASEGAIEEAGADLKAAAELENAFNLKITQSRTAGLDEKAKTLEAAKKDAAKLLENAEAQARHTLESERAALKRALEDTRQALHTEEGNLVSLIVKKLEAGEGDRTIH